MSLGPGAAPAGWPRPLPGVQAPDSLPSKTRLSPGPPDSSPPPTQHSRGFALVLRASHSWAWHVPRTLWLVSPQVCSTQLLASDSEHRGPGPQDGRAQRGLCSGRLGDPLCLGSGRRPQFSLRCYPGVHPSFVNTGTHFSESSFTTLHVSVSAAAHSPGFIPSTQAPKLSSSRAAPAVSRLSRTLNFPPSFLPQINFSFWRSARPDVWMHQ